MVVVVVGGSCGDGVAAVVTAFDVTAPSQLLLCFITTADGRFWSRDLIISWG